MYKIVTQEMLRAALVKAVEIKLIPKHSLLADYLKSGVQLEQVIQAALEAQPKKPSFVG